ncbi:MAG: lysoplasmalogenase [Pyrinomonadaceae bacterium]
MIYNTTAILIATICMANAALYVFAEWRDLRSVRAICKLAASISFIVLAIVNGAVGTTYGRLILTAFIFSWVGDALLLSLRSSFLLAGIAAFFIAHLAFATAFALEDLDVSWLFSALVFLSVAALVLLRWLWKYLGRFYRIAVPVYLTAITIMTSLAISASAASMSPLLAIAAMAFAASDVSVARNRFIGRSIINKAWGLPLYYAAQLLFAMSVLPHR